MEKLTILIRGGILTEVRSSIKEVDVELLDYDNIELGDETIESMESKRVAAEKTCPYTVY